MDPCLLLLRLLYLRPDATHRCSADGAKRPGSGFVFAAGIDENVVRISTGDVSAETGGGGAKERVPAVYNQPTTLKVDVEKRPNTFDFDLQSDAGAILDAPTE